MPVPLCRICKRPLVNHVNETQTCRGVCTGIYKQRRRKREADKALADYKRRQKERMTV